MKVFVKIGFIFIILLVGNGALFAQSPYRDQPEPSVRSVFENPTGFQMNGLLDPSRISMSHSAGMSYMSAGGNGYTQGYYMNTLNYRFSAPLSMNLRLGVTNNPFSNNSSMGSTGFGPSLGEAEFFGGADLNWRPKENLFIRFSFDKLPPGAYYTGFSGYNGYALPRHDHNRYEAGHGWISDY
ncbi:hypothetical protein K8I28_14055 [bacterium]|nr:hypothetical protein [bacterium]